jgi:hypothetical protein
MLKILATIAGVIAIAVVGVLAYATTKPDTFRVERSITVNATPEKIFPLINDFRAWREWSPYEDRDPDLKRTYSQPASGKGAVYSWDGNSNVGSGRMEILEASHVGEEPLGAVVREHGARVEQGRARVEERCGRRAARRPLHEVRDREDPRTRQRRVHLRDVEPVSGQEADQRRPHALVRALDAVLRQVDVREPNVRAVVEALRRNARGLDRLRERAVLGAGLVRALVHRGPGIPRADRRGSASAARAWRAPVVPGRSSISACSTADLALVADEAQRHRPLHG